jgi:ergothioneine biosynthesis protein EgtB
MTDTLTQTLSDRFCYVRGTTDRLAAPLTPEDQQLQSMPDASPTKWHRAHTTWFFETFVLGPHGVPRVDDAYGYLYNSYYNAVGPRHPRPRRGMVSRPSAEEVGEFRRLVDERMLALFASLDEPALEAIRPVVELGLAHEEQHQELILTDILHAFSGNPIEPVYRRCPPRPTLAAAAPLAFVEFPGGLHELGAEADDGFTFDNEHPRHRVWLEPYALSTRLVTVGEMRAFIDAGGYRTPSLWLSAGYDWVRANEIEAPGYVHLEDGEYRVFGLTGSRVAGDAEPVTHVSFYEADALARFLDARLPTEAEWETACRAANPSRDTANLLESGALRAQPPATSIAQLFGDAWEWTMSSYSPYPGYAPAPGALGEYNGKFMANQYVLRGGSCFTPRAHIRASYRNFWPPDTRFQMTGLRLARSV